MHPPGVAEVLPDVRDSDALLQDRAQKNATGEITQRARNERLEAVAALHPTAPPSGAGVAIGTSSPSLVQTRVRRTITRLQQGAYQAVDVRGNAFVNKDLTDQAASPNEAQIAAHRQGGRD